jgi:hypothetical protein
VIYSVRHELAQKQDCLWKTLTLIVDDVWSLDQKGKSSRSTKWPVRRRRWVCFVDQGKQARWAKAVDDKKLRIDVDRMINVPVMVRIGMLRIIITILKRLE